MANVAALKEAKDRLSRIGRTPVDLAKEMAVDLTVVRGVLNGRLKGERGDAHRVAVALGLKDGIILANDVSTVDAMAALAK